MLLKNGLREWNRPGRCLTLDEIARSSRFFILRLFWLEEYKGGRKFSLLKKEIKKDREEFTKFQLLFSFLTEASFLYKYKFCGEIEKLYFETYDCVYIETYTERDRLRVIYLKICCIFTRMNLSIVHCPAIKGGKMNLRLSRIPWLNKLSCD